MTSEVRMCQPILIRCAICHEREQDPYNMASICENRGSKQCHDMKNNNLPQIRDGICLRCQLAFKPRSAELKLMIR